MEKSSEAGSGEQRRSPLIYEDHISELRNRMLDTIMWFGALVGVPMMVHVCTRYFIYQGMVWEMFVQLGAYFSIWVFLIFKNRIHYRFRAAFILGGLLLSATIGLMRFGVFSFAPLTLFASVVLSGFLLGRIHALVVGIGVVFVYTLIAVLFQEGFLSYPFPTEAYANRYVVWTGWIVASLAYLVVTLICMDLIYRFLRKKIDESEHYRREMIEQNERLLHQTQALEEAKRSLERAIQVKDEFLGMMSHELRSPIGPILGVTDLLESASDQDKTKLEQLQVIRSSAERLRHSIDQILNMTSIKSASFTHQPSWVSMPSVFEKLRLDFEPLFREKRIAFALLMDPTDSHQYFIDREKLTEVLTQLISNALKFSRAGHVTVECARLNPNGADMAELFFTVKDEGIGMPAERFDEIQDVFTQLDAGTSRAFDGLGLGLAIVARLAAVMNAKLVFDSKEGAGTTVSLYVTTPTKVSEKKEPEQLTPFAEETKIEGLRILVVDDDRANQVYSREVLKSLKSNPMVATNGEDALEVCRERSFDLILMDVSMPVMDGMETTRAIRLLEGHKKTAIIGLTAHNQKSIHLQCREAGMNGSIMKPVTREKLLGLLEENYEGICEERS